MKKKFHEYSKITALVVAVVIIGAFDLYGMPSSFYKKEKQDSIPVATTEPVVKTESTPQSNFTSVTFPQNYSGEVRTVCDGTTCTTNTRKYSPEELKKMEEDMRARQIAIEEYMQAQQRYFDSLWRTHGVFPMFPF